MQKILSLLRRCVEDYDMIAPGERVAVGVSGGKDSLVLLAALARLAQFYPGGFSVEAFTVDMGTPGMDLSPLADYCRELGVPFHRIPTQMYHVIFETRREKNPCALCAKMRRGSSTPPCWRRAFTRSPWATTMTTRWRPSSSPCFMRAACPASTP